MDVTAAVEPLPLRALKAARTRHALISACIDQLQTRDFGSVRVADLCETVGVTEQTFFNYFPGKGLLLSHIILLWGIETEYHLRRFERRGAGGLATIDEAFAFSATKMAGAPRVAAALLARQATRIGPPRFPEITSADRLTWFPGSPGIEEIPGIGILGILRPRIEKAIRTRELPGTADTETVLRALYAIFVGVPVLLLWEDPAAIGGAFREQLRILWRGLGGTKPSP